MLHRKVHSLSHQGSCLVQSWLITIDLTNIYKALLYFSVYRQPQDTYYGWKINVNRNRAYLLIKELYSVMVWLVNCHEIDEQLCTVKLVFNGHP